MFRFVIQKSTEFSGGFGSSSRVDERVSYFVNLFEQIENFNSVTELKVDIKKSLNLIMVS